MITHKCGVESIVKPANFVKINNNVAYVLFITTHSIVFAYEPANIDVIIKPGLRVFDKFLVKNIY